MVSTNFTFHPQNEYVLKTMNRFTPVMKYKTLLLLLSLLLTQQAVGQVRISCDEPKVRDWASAKVTLEIGKQQCDEAKDLAKMATNLRKESEWFKNNAESEKNKAKELREQHENRMRDSKKRLEEASDVEERKEKHEKEIEEYLEFLEKRNKKFSEEITFTVYDTSSVATPIVNGLDWKMGQEKVIEGLDNYKMNVMALLDTDESAIDSMGILLEVEGNSILQRAEMHEMRSQQHFTTAATTLQLAEQMEGAAQVTERAAVMHLVKATIEFVSEKATANSKRVKKDVERGVSFIEENLDKVPDDVALYAQYEIAKVK